MPATTLLTMPAPVLLLILSAVFPSVRALPWTGPEPTAAYLAHEWSPRPTTGPGAAAVDLFGRSAPSIEVCGWIGGISSQPAVCSAGSSCIHDTAHGYIGCCTTSGPCTAGVYTSCVDYHNPAWKSDPVWQNDGIYTCPGKLECYQNSYPDSYSAWACGASSDATTVQTTYSGQPADEKLQIVFTAVTFSPMSTSASTTSSSSSSSSASSTSSSSSSTSSTSSASSSPTSTASSSSKSHVSGGVIAAIVIVPLFIIALLVGAFFLWRRKRKAPPKYLERPSSFTGVFRSGNTPDSNNPGNFPEMQLAHDPPSVSEQQPFSPDDYVSPMTEGAHITSPGNAAVISPPGAYGSIQERMNAGEANPYAMPEESQFLRPAGAVSEIEHFSGAYMAAIGVLSPMTPPRPQMGQMQNNQPMHPAPPRGNDWLAALTGVDGVPAAPAPLQPRPDASREVAPAPAPAPVNRFRDESIDAFAALEKETEGYAKRKYSTEPFPLYEAPRRTLSENVREEGWVPSGLRPNKRAPSSPNRYQLVDQEPDITEGARILYEPGQLRGENGR